MALEDELYLAHDDRTVFNAGYQTMEPFERQNGSITLTPPKRSPQDRPRPRTFGGIIHAVSFIDSALPRYKYANFFDTKENSHVSEEDIEQGSFRGYNYRYWMFKRNSCLPSQSPLVRLFALAFLEDVAKKQAVEAIKTRLDTIVPAGPSFAFVPPREVDNVVTNFKHQIAPTQYHLGYLSRIKTAEPE